MSMFQTKRYGDMAAKIETKNTLSRDSLFVKKCHVSLTRKTFHNYKPLNKPKCPKQTTFFFSSLPQPIGQTFVSTTVKRLCSS